VCVSVCVIRVPLACKVYDTLSHTERYHTCLSVITQYDVQSLRLHWLMIGYKYNNSLKKTCIFRCIFSFVMIIVVFGNIGACCCFNYPYDHPDGGDPALCWSQP